jgi:hypothetical protein
MSASTSLSRVTVMLTWPFEFELPEKVEQPVDAGELLLDTWVTVDSTVSADAPGKLARMFTEGGAMSGYCSMGSVNMPPSPASMMTIAMTQAKMGRSTKMREIIGASAGRLTGARAAAGLAPTRRAGRRPRRACRHRPHGVAGLDPQQPLRDHAVSGIEPGGDEPLVADRCGRP